MINIVELDSNNRPKGRNHHRFRNLTGKRFGRLLVIRQVGWHIHPDGSRRAKWMCVCDCGNLIVTLQYNLTSGDGRSCGCRKRDINSQIHRTHGLCKHPDYQLWGRMIQRCGNVRNEDYPNYGGRGITVCKRWRESFAAFHKDMGTRPSKRNSIDRRDVNKGYFKKNCRWVTSDIQCRNKRNTRWITIDGETLCLSDWSRLVSMRASKILRRMKRGWTPKRAVFTK